jgi:hypothetical protein
MKIAYLILTHKNPAQVERLIRALDHSAFDFYIHLDKKVDATPFLHLAEMANVFFVNKRVDVKWAAYSLVQAQLNGIEEILQKNKYDYISVLSGQDFPIKSPEFIYKFFCDNKGYEFISCVDENMEPAWWEVAWPRVTKYHFESWNVKGKYRFQSIFNALMPVRKHPLGHTLVGRSQWFNITNESASYMISFLKQHPEVVRFFKFVWGADEFIFSTILYNSPYRDRIREFLFYIDWSELKPNPKLLKKDDYPELLQSDKLFARKFDQEIDGEILNMLEDLIGKRNLYKAV